MGIEDRFKKAVEIKETIPAHEISFAFIKPDFINDLPEIEKILKDHGLSILYKDKIILNENAIDDIYKDSKGEHFYSAMKEYLTKNKVVVLMVHGKGSEVQKVLLSLKKVNGKNGIIRERFQKEPPVSSDDLALWNERKHPKQDEVSVLLTQKNVIHTSDNAEEALSSLKLILGDRFKNLEERGNLPAELWGIFNNDKK
ncbi:MAG: hypothetical protein UT05_C0013G0017 [Parcubacteria group bacterium GW2011_GWF2_38_76]|nr:MAG: hypothetical protein UT05_C0013G0017 [Parcubacteria group bacterium GW2011_GWF2_38_76]HBM45391.1 hypothetical protein [Patescibacteria group bacterium]